MSRLNHNNGSGPNLIQNTKRSHLYHRFTCRTRNMHLTWSTFTTELTGTEPSACLLALCGFYSNCTDVLCSLQGRGNKATETNFRVRYIKKHRVKVFQHLPFVLHLVFDCFCCHWQMYAFSYVNMHTTLITLFALKLSSFVPGTAFS